MVSSLCSAEGADREGSRRLQHMYVRKSAAPTWKCSNAKASSSNWDSKDALEEVSVRISMELNVEV